MAHPHHEHRQSKIEKSRVSHLTKGYATGGAVHSDEAEDKKLVRKMVRKQALKVDGSKPKHRADRAARKKGGRVNGKTTVNVIVPPSTPGPMAGMAPMPPTPMAAPAPAMAPPMPPHPPMGAPAGGPAPMPMRKRGGRVNEGSKVYEEGVRAGTQISHDPGKNDLKDMNRGKPVTYRKGGSVCRATGGKVEAPQKRESTAPAFRGGPTEHPKKGGMSPHLPGGAGGGKARLTKARMA